MSGQYPPALNVNTQQSPLNRANPNAFSPASGAPTSYKTNVNRQKTKKWVEAKTVSYDGDDWAEEDDGYDDDFEEQPQPAMPEPPRGLRQKGQTLNTAAARGTTDPRKGYGDLGQGAGNQQYPQRAATAPVPPPGQGQRGRGNSFDEGDEKRAFSTGTPVPQANNPMSPSSGSQPPFNPNNPGKPSPTPASHGIPPIQTHLRSASHQPRTQSPPTNYRGVSYSPQPNGRNNADRTRSMDSNSPAGDFRDFRKRSDYSPSAVPQALHMRSGGGHSMSSEPGAFPPRKSSLSQKESPLAAGTRGSTETAPGTSPRLEQSNISSRRVESPGSPSAKPLPFIRPADIYKRIEEERERERQSMDSGRPSMDSILGKPPATEPGTTPSLVVDRRSTESPVHNLRNRPSWDGGDDTDSSGSRRLKPMLDPVIERKSEYGFENFANLENVQPSTVAGSPGAVPSAKIPGSAPPSSDDGLNKSESKERDPPMLPLVSRFSGFGDAFWTTPSVDTEHISSQKSAGEQRVPPVPTEDPSKESTNIPVQTLPEADNTQEHHVQNKPSLGFRSMVHDAFDRPDDTRSVPPTPSSRADSQRSQGGLSVSRQDSTSTSGLSPIMSGMPSSTLHPSISKEEFEARKASTPAIAEVMEESESNTSRPPSAGGSFVPNKIPRKESPAHSRNASNESNTASQTGDHHRTTGGPSPGTSPARAPNITTNAVMTGDSVEMVNETPISSGLNDRGFEENGLILEVTPSIGDHGDYSSREADMASAVRKSPDKEATEATTAISHAAQESFLESRNNNPGDGSELEASSPITRVDSPASKGKVRDLTDHYETVSRTGSVRSASTKSIPLMGKSQEDLSSTRPTTDRVQSFRPALPGGWNSYSTQQDSSTGDVAGTDPMLEAPPADRKVAPSPLQWDEDKSKEFANEIAIAASGGAVALHEVQDRVSESDDDFEPDPTTVNRSLPETHGDLEGRDQPNVPEVVEPSDLDVPRGLEVDSDKEQQNYSTAVPEPGNVASQISMPPPPRPISSAERSIPPTPPPKDTPLALETEGQEYFSPPVPLKHKKREDVSSPPQVQPLRPSMLPTISTDYSPQDQESDRLRKEIYKSLSPTTPRAGDTGEDRLSPTTPTSAATGRESTLLPIEYDSYWASTNEGENIQTLHSPVDTPTEPQADVSNPVPETIVHASSPVADTNRRFELQDQATSGEPEQQTLNEGLQVRPVLKQRFSWEEPTEPIDSQLSQPPSITVPQPATEPIDNLATTDLAYTVPPLTIRTSNNPSDTSETSPITPADRTSIQYADGLEVADGTERQRDLGLDTEPISATLSGPENFQSPSDQTYNNKEFHNPTNQLQSPRTEQRSLSPLRSHPVSASSIHNLEMSQQERSSTTDLAKSPSSESQALPSPQPQPTSSFQPTQAPRILTFREIMALKSPHERINAFNNARDQFYDINYGLHGWLSFMTTSNPEYLASPGRGSASKTPTRQQAQQQPYYQQYLAASSASPTSSSHPQHGSSPSSGGGPAGPSGFGSSPLSSSGTVSGRHMQAKGKELLHSAGVFGKKGGDAAKGLFAKGRSKFRSGSGTGGLD